MYRIDGKSVEDLRYEKLAMAKKAEAERLDYIQRQIQKNKLRRQHANDLLNGRDRQEIEREQIADSLGHLKFPRFLFEKWAAMNPPKASSKMEDVIWSCGSCQVTVMPSVVEYGYIRGNCACQQRASEEKQRREEEARQEQQQKERIAAMFKTISRFSWLAPQHHLAKCTFENFDLGRVDPQDLNDVELAYGFLSAFVDAPSGNALVYGPHGSGKTHLCSALLNEWDKRGKTCLYVNALDLFAEIDNRRLLGQDTLEIEKLLRYADLIVWDEVDRVKMTDTRFGVYYRIVNYRSQKEMECPGSAPTIMICNTTIKRSIGELDGSIGTPTSSRMQIGLTMLRVPGKDQRCEVL